MTRNEIIFYIGVAVVVTVAEVGNRYGAGCLALPLLVILAYLTAFVFPPKPTNP